MSSVSPRPFRAAVLGSPVAHSLSPALYTAGFAAAGLTGWRYDRIECDAERLPGLVGGSGPDWAGFSVTMPGKAAAAAVADFRSERVELLGVANTLYRAGAGSACSAGSVGSNGETGTVGSNGETGTVGSNGETGTVGGWYAENTDVDGVLGALQAAEVTPRRALVLGGGGTARSVVVALAELGAIEVTLAGRRPQSVSGCVDLADAVGLPAQTCDLSVTAVTAVTAGVDVVVSTVPAGAADQLAGVLAAVPVLLDVVYAPWPTALAAASVGDRIVVTGLDMLLHQAFRQFELFTGGSAPRAAMRAGLLAASGATLPLPIGHDGRSDVE